jgi:hypothetical protein
MPNVTETVTARATLRLAEWRRLEMTERKILRIRKPPFEQSCGVRRTRRGNSSDYDGIDYNS